jgi:hypothetical protein
MIIMTRTWYLHIFLILIHSCSSNLLDYGGFIVVAHELLYFDTKYLPFLSIVSYFSYYPGPGFFKAVVNSSSIKIIPGFVVLGRIENDIFDNYD